MLHKQPVGKSQTFPLPDNHFPKVDLNEQLLDAFHKEVTATLHQTLQFWQQYCIEKSQYFVHHAPWKVCAKVNNLRCYKRSHSAQSTNLYHLIGQIDGWYRDVMQFFHTESREEFIGVQKILNTSLKDAAILKNIIDAESPDVDGSIVYMGIRWALYESFATRLRVDACVLECIGFSIDGAGGEFGYRIIIPVQIPECPVFTHTRHKVLRMCTKSVELFMPSVSGSHNKTNVFAMVQSDQETDGIPRFHQRRYLKNLDRIAEHWAGLQLSKRKVVNKLDVARISRCNSSCSNCRRTFKQAVSSPHVCGLCGEILCRSCIVLRAVAVRGSKYTSDTKPLVKLQSLWRNLFVSKVKLCRSCVETLRKDRLSALGTPVPYISFLSDFQARSSMDTMSFYKEDCEFTIPALPLPESPVAIDDISKFDCTSASCLTQPESEGEEEMENHSNK
uniref:Uncharacterized protein AlNc14C90G5655 n=1 Tax=Albugo laibachii Nc14 TaxID=890382 RepID=F0WGC4_9STRA|nr:conserved hypothetical protein [Albugo laibachii Nc14]|eukprot:CCA20284.1 conserved hypothetical protein [Albugo laibachii Nc14]